MHKLALIVFSIFSLNVLSQQPSSSPEEKEILKMEKELAARKRTLKKKQALKQQKLQEIKRKQEALKLQEAELYSTKNKNIITKQPKTGMRKREYFIDGSSILFISLEDILKFENTDEEKFSSNNLFLEGGKNFGQFEAATFYSKVYENDRDFETKSTTFGLLGTINLIRNEPGNDLIPFIQSRLALSKFERLGSGSFVTNSTSLFFGAGAKYFPFGEFISIKAALDYRTVEGSTRSEFTRKGFRFRTNVQIYF